LTCDWEPCQAFVRMTKHEELPRYQIEHNNTSLYLTHPNGERISIQNDETHTERLSSWFSHNDMRLSKSNDKTAYWDHCDAHISLINITTVESIAKTAGIRLDPQRFRGNLLIETKEPWSEFSLVGHRISIGSVELEILRPIDRCKATSVNPLTGSSDINIPHLLSSQYGHIFCGIYARVVKPGKIESKDKLCLLSPALNAINDSVKVNTAPKPTQWPRFMRLVKRVKESHNVESFWLEDPLFCVNNKIEPASYIRLHAQCEDEPLTRSYTISRHNGVKRLLRISIKKEAGGALFSPWIHSSLKVGDTILASGPFVDPSMAWRPHRQPHRELLIITAGIGITVATSILSVLKNINYPCKINIVHSIRVEKDSALWQEVLEYSSKKKNITPYLYVTQGSDVTQSAYKKTGRIDIADVTKNLSLDNIQVFLCGPKKFGESMSELLIQKGVNCDAIHQDIFCSPKPVLEPTDKAASLIRSVPIRFVHRTGEVSNITWQPKHRSLLNAAEQHGLSISANCRSGACRTCLYRIEGPIENLITPVSPAPKNWAYLCCAAPLSSITIKENSHDE